MVLATLYGLVVRLEFSCRIVLHRAGSTAEAVSVAMSTGSADNPVIEVAVLANVLTVTYADGTSASFTLAVGGGGGSADTADLLVERLGTLDNPTLPADREWVGTGVMIPTGVHVLMIDAGQVSDDYHLVDWDAVLMRDVGVAGTFSSVGMYETFAGDAFTVLRIGHDGNGQFLVANDSTDSVNLLHIHVERLLAPVAVGGGESGDAQSIVDAHALVPNAHHVPPAGVGQGVTQEGLDTAIATHTGASTAHHTPPTHDAELVLKVERDDVSAGVGIAVTPVAGNASAFTISTTGSNLGPTLLQGTWTWRQNDPQPVNGDVAYNANETLGDPDDWLFHAGTGYEDARTQLLDLAAGDQVEIEMVFVFGVSARDQLITVTSTPTISGNVVTVSGRPDNPLSHQIPVSGQELIVTLIPRPYSRRRPSGKG